MPLNILVLSLVSWESSVDGSSFWSLFLTVIVISEEFDKLLTHLTNYNP